MAWLQDSTGTSVHLSSGKSYSEIRKIPYSRLEHCVVNPSFCKFCIPESSRSTSDGPLVLAVNVEPSHPHWHLPQQELKWSQNLIMRFSTDEVVLLQFLWMASGLLSRGNMSFKHIYIIYIYMLVLQI